MEWVSEEPRTKMEWAAEEPRTNMEWVGEELEQIWNGLMKSLE